VAAVREVAVEGPRPVVVVAERTKRKRENETKERRKEAKRSASAREFERRDVPFSLSRARARDDALAARTRFFRAAAPRRGPTSWISRACRSRTARRRLGRSRSCSVRHLHYSTSHYIKGPLRARRETAPLSPLPPLCPRAGRDDGGSSRRRGSRRPPQRDMDVHLAHHTERSIYT